MKIDKADITAIRLLSVPLTELAHESEVLAAAPHLEGSPDEIIRALHWLAEQATRVAVYLDARWVRAASHKEAVKRQNKAADAVQRTLGYTYPSDIEF